MKSVCVVVLLLFLIATGCHKTKEYQCTYTVYHTIAYTGMQGFDTTELHTIYVREYLPDGSFSHLTKSDTIITDNLEISGGIAYRHNAIAFFTALGEGKHYEIEVPAAARLFRIAGVYYHGPTSFTVTVSSCLPRTFTNAPDSAVVDGQPVHITQYTGAASYFFLQK